MEKMRQEEMKMIDIHADDFGESLHASNEIIECLKAGKLDSISILSNMSCFQSCVKIYRDAEPSFVKKPLLSVHINLVDGKPLSDLDEISDLLDKDGYLCASWEKLFLKSFLPGRGNIKKQIKKEIKAQVRAVQDAFPECASLRIDSHRHTHMIPIVADALFEAIEEEEWNVTYIRDAREPLSPFLKTMSLYKTYKPINFIKNIMLRFCSLLLAPKFRRMGLEPMYLWGLAMSGYMDIMRVDRLLNNMKRVAIRNERTLEILFHPGRVLKSEISEEFNQAESVLFYISNDREIEKETVMNGNWK